MTISSFSGTRNSLIVNGGALSIPTLLMPFHQSGGGKLITSSLSGLGSVDVDSVLEVGSITGDTTTNVLEKVGAGELILKNASTSFANNIVINAGTVTAQNPSALGNSGGSYGSTQVNSGAVLKLDMAGSSVSVNPDTIILANGKIRAAGPGTIRKYTFQAPIKVLASAAIGRIDIERNVQLDAKMGVIGGADRAIRLDGKKGSSLHARKLTTGGRLKMRASGTLKILTGDAFDLVVIDPIDPNAQTIDGKADIQAEKPDLTDPFWADATPEDLDMPTLQSVQDGQVATNVNTGVDTDYGIYVDTAGFNSTIAEPVMGSGTLKKIGGGKLSLPDVRSNRLEAAEGSVEIAPLSATSRVASLSVGSTAKVDLTNNDLIIDYTGTSPAADIRSMLISGRSGGTWDGNGVATSLATVSSDTHARALGYADTAVFGLTLFAGESVDNSSIVIKYTFGGDCSLDGLVNFADLVPISQNYGLFGKVWTTGDVTYDGVVDFADLIAMSQNYNYTGALRRGGEDDDGAYAVFLELQAGAPWILEDALTHPEGYALFSPYLNDGGSAARGVLGATQLQHYNLTNNLVPEPTTLLLAASSVALFWRRR